MGGMLLIREYARAVWKYWYTLVPGAAASFLGFLKDVCGVSLDPIPSWLFWTVGIGGVVAAQFLAYLDQRRHLKAFELPIYDMPILDVIGIASDHGWDWVDGWQYLDLQDALHAAAANGMISVWGRRPDTHPLTPLPPVIISTEILGRAQLKLPLQMNGEMKMKNAETTVLSTKPGEYFRDLHVCRAQILFWINSKHAKSFIGKRVREK